MFSSKKVQEWGQLDIPVFGISEDWYGAPLVPQLGFSLLVDPRHLWFVVTRESAGFPRPHSAAGSFTSELWKHDVAELFLANGETGEYLEFNLAPNGAWWAAKFDAPRHQIGCQPDFSGISTYHHEGSKESWTCALSIPRILLDEHINFGLKSTANVCAILNSPEQTFHSVQKLPGNDPDFHQPSSFTQIEIQAIPDK